MYSINQKSDGDELKVGGGASPRNGDLVVIHLKGKIQGNHQVFVDTFDRDQKPLALIYYEINQSWRQKESRSSSQLGVRTKWCGFRIGSPDSTLGNARIHC
ncbi:hypothetical protein V6N13_117056 [Hibiscus sabdariffa]